jgi:nitrate reductase gamma subunit
MEQWLEWARGPFFRFSLALMVLGLLRLFILNTLNLREILRRANEREIPWKYMLRETFSWLLPVKKSSHHPVYTVVSFIFHLAIIITPIFLGAHIRLWERGLGISWPALPQVVADYLTLIALVTALMLFALRARARAARALSRLQDYALPLLIAVPFLTGYLAMHPALNPVAYNPTMLVHVLSANLVLILLPFSKLSHVVLLPTAQVVSEMAWFLEYDSGSKVAAALGKEHEAI